MTEQERDFKSKSLPDQIWILYQAIAHINEDGCAWALRKYNLKRFSILGVSIGVGLGFALIVGKIAHGF